MRTAFARAGTEPQLRRRDRSGTHAHARSAGPAEERLRRSAARGCQARSSPRSGGPLAFSSSLTGSYQTHPSSVARLRRRVLLDLAQRQSGQIAERIAYVRKSYKSGGCHWWRCGSSSPVDVIHPYVGGLRCCDSMLAKLLQRRAMHRPDLREAHDGLNARVGSRSVEYGAVFTQSGDSSTTARARPACC